MEELKITKGEFELKYVSGICIGIGTKGNYSINTANTILPETDEEYEAQKGNIEADMKLYAEAGTIANQTGRTPSQLLNERNELLNNCKELLELLSFHGYNNSTEIYNAKQAIEKATK